MFLNVFRPDEYRVSYNKAGFTIIRQLFNQDEIGAVASDIDKVVGDLRYKSPHNLRCRWQRNIFSEHPVLDALDPIIDVSLTCKRVAQCQKVQNLLVEVFEERCCLFNDRLIIKMPGTEGYPLHQDCVSCFKIAPELITLVVAIDSADEQSGCTEVFGGHHHRGYLGNPESTFCSLVDLSEVEGTAPTSLILDPGDAVLFSSFTPHRSGPNRSSKRRRQLYLSFNRMSDGGDLRDVHYKELRQWLATVYETKGLSVYFE
jgi:ectoine hydroxylase-related dioxygenase (phytanoyl-CoA dioxygenase family)